jgi:rhamnose utilization protein RhaD (predicted bifunctional aldolase and dehydrogenase)
LKAWNEAEAGTTEIEQVFYLSNLIGGDLSLVQPGGGNTSVKLTEPDIFGFDVSALVVKGSGTDLRTIGPGGFTHLYVDRLALLQQRELMSDEEMMAAMRACQLFPDRDPLPSVETPLHSLLPARFVAHTHDVATLSLTDTPDAERNVRRVFGPEVAFLEYVRPGFPLAKRLAERYAEGPEKRVLGLVMEKHGLAVWGETARQCYGTLRAIIGQAEAFVAESRKGKRVFGAAVAPVSEERERRAIAAAVMPVIRGELMGHGFRCVLHLDEAPQTLEAISGERFSEIASRGVMTPEHVLRAGVRPLVVAADEEPSAGVAVRKGIREYREEYRSYSRRHGQESISDFLKTVVIPGVGIVFAGKDRRNALVAADCYRATMEVMAGAEAVERFEFISEAEQAEVEYWPLERRKIEEGAKSRRELEGKVALVIGAASGIGRAAALRFAE